MRASFQFCLLLIILLPAASLSFSQTVDKSTKAIIDSAAGPVKVELTLEGGKTVYRTGEPIKLILSFVAAAESLGFQLNTTTTKPASPIDEIIISPTGKVFPWLDVYSGAERYYPDFSAVTNLSPVATNVELTVNNWYRFDQPGHYSVKVKTSRVRTPTPGIKERFSSGPALSLTTNEVNFEIKQMSAAEEAAEVQRLAALIDASSDWRAQTEYAEELSYLTGDISIAEKVKRFLHPPANGPGNFHQAISLGLYISKNRNLVIKLLEDELHDPAKEPSYSILYALVRLRLMQERAKEKTVAPLDAKAAWQQELKRSAEIKQAYLKEIADSLPKRSGSNLTTAAMTLLINLAPDTPNDNPTVVKVREILLREFDNLSPEFTQETLLRAYWNRLRDPVLAPKLEKILQTYHGQYALNVRATALERLWDLSPQKARPYFIEEIKDPASLVSLDLLEKITDPVLPEADAPLLEQIRTAAVKNDPVYLRTKSMRAARFASPAIYDELMKIYQNYGSQWWFDKRAPLLAYFARYDKSEAVPLIEKELANPGTGSPFSFLGDLTESYYSEPVNEVLVRRLESADPETANSAAYFMARNGPAINLPLLQARLARWRKEWSGRIPEIDSEASDQKIRLQANVESELISGLLNAKSWKLPDEEILSLKQSCLTKVCRSRFANRQ